MDGSNRDNHDHFLRLYVENEEALRGFVRSLVPTLEDAREVMQDVAAVLWRKFDHSIRPKTFAVGPSVWRSMKPSPSAATGRGIGTS